MIAAVIVDVSGGRTGGAARFLDELYGYLKRSGREDVEIIGSRRRVRPGWLLQRELSSRARQPAGGAQQRRVCRPRRPAVDPAA